MAYMCGLWLVPRKARLMTQARDDINAAACVCVMSRTELNYMTPARVVQWTYGSQTRPIADTWPAARVLVFLEWSHVRRRFSFFVPDRACLHRAMMGFRQKRPRKRRYTVRRTATRDSEQSPSP